MTCCLMLAVDSCSSPMSKLLDTLQILGEISMGPNSAETARQNIRFCASFEAGLHMCSELCNGAN